MRPSQRQPNELRPIQFQHAFTQHAEGSVLVSFGNTRVLCNASIETSVPRFLKDANQGWVTAEYGMLPRSTNERMRREASQGKQSGRTVEIQRLIGRSLRATMDLKALGQHTITVDCDVIQADGGTRTAAITGCCLAIQDAVHFMLKHKMIKNNPIKPRVAAVSVGIYKGKAILDLDYAEDSQCDTDMNVIMNDQQEFIEIQGTAEGNCFSHTELNEMLSLAQQGIHSILAMQNTNE